MFAACNRWKRSCLVFIYPLYRFFLITCSKAEGHCVVLSPFTPFCQQHYLLKKWVLCKASLSQLRTLWSKVNRGERRPQPSRWLLLVQRQNVESLSSVRTLSSAESLRAPGEGWLPSLQKREEALRHCSLVLKSGTGCPITHLFPTVQAEEKAKGEKVSCWSFLCSRAKLSFTVI